MNQLYQAPAKINLTLAVLGRRQDGFHEIESCAAPIGLYDELRVTAGNGFHLRVEGSLSCASDETNLVHQAAHTLAASAGREPKVQIVLTKEIPVGAGLGGGSSDAAATLLALSQLWGLNWPVKRILPIAAKLGSDVPFFVGGRPAILRGRGDLVESFELANPMWAAIVVPPYSLATADVYRRFDEIQRAPVRTHSVPAPGSRKTAREWMEQSFNDLEPAAFSCEPRLKVLHRCLNQESDRAVRMSGSGSALFTLFDDKESARQWTARVNGARTEQFTLHVLPVLTKSTSLPD